MASTSLSTATPDIQPGPARPKSRRALWWVTVTLSGGVVMGLELAAFRLYAPYFGYSIYVWGSMIAAIMLALSGGYTLGGKLADRSQGDARLYAMVLVSGMWQIAALLGAHALLRQLASLDELTGPALATAAIFAPPMVLLAAVGPYVIRLDARSGHVGEAAGGVSTFSTLGGVVGVLATSFWMLPNLGTANTLASLAGLTLLVGALGAVVHRRGAAALPLVLLLTPLASTSQAPDGLVWSAESAYNLVRVVRHGTVHGLMLNAQSSVHSIRREDGWSGRYYDDFSLGPLLVASPQRALILGLGAGASLGPLWAAAPGLRIDAVELDPRVVEAGHRFFALPRHNPRLSIHVADARRWIRRNRGPWQLIELDMYQGGPVVPFYLTTQEFYQQVADRLAPGGVVMSNVFDAGEGRPLLMAQLTTLGSVFSSVFVLPRPSGNHTLLAFSSPHSLAQVKASLASARSPNPRVRQQARQAAAALKQLETPPELVPWTDDHAPVEQLSRRIMGRR